MGWKGTHVYLPKFGQNDKEIMTFLQASPVLRKQFCVQVFYMVSIICCTNDDLITLNLSGMIPNL